MIFFKNFIIYIDKNSLLHWYHLLAKTVKSNIFLAYQAVTCNISILAGDTYCCSVLQHLVCIVLLCYTSYHLIGNR